MRNCLLMIACALFLSACGYKGPLMLPKPKPAAAQPAPTAAPAPKKENDDQ